MKDATMLQEGTSSLNIISHIQETKIRAFEDLARFKATAAKPFRIYPVLKRAIDIIISFFGLIISSPLWLTIMAAIKLDTAGPALFFQERYGKDGKVFKQWKFRSMIADAEKYSGPVIASEKDPRVTKVGSILRKTAMDELPQLVNILLGDMSFVGPRPERPYLVDNQILPRVPGFHLRHAIRPGLTGVAQVYGRYNTEPKNKLRYDMIYIKNCNFFLDMKLFLLSFWITFQAKWQVRGKRI